MEGPQEIGIHDLDIVIDPDRLRRILDELGDRRCIGFNELVAYTHSRIAVFGGSSIKIRFDYDHHYCYHFKENVSEWTLHLSDNLREKLAKLERVAVFVDSGKIVETVRPSVYFTESMALQVPEGTGSHTIGYSS